MESGKYMYQTSIHEANIAQTLAIHKFLIILSHFSSKLLDWKEELIKFPRT
jgi:hypothetical protein